MYKLEMMKMMRYYEFSDLLPTACGKALRTILYVHVDGEHMRASAHDAERMWRENPEAYPLWTEYPSLTPDRIARYMNYNVDRDLEASAAQEPEPSTPVKRRVKPRR